MVGDKSTVWAVCRLKELVEGLDGGGRDNDLVGAVHVLHRHYGPGGKGLMRIERTPDRRSGSFRGRSGGFDGRGGGGGGGGGADRRESRSTSRRSSESRATNHHQSSEPRREHTDARLYQESQRPSIPPPVQTLGQGAEAAASESGDFLAALRSLMDE